METTNYNVATQDEVLTQQLRNHQNSIERFGGKVNSSVNTEEALKNALDNILVKNESSLKEGMVFRLKGLASIVEGETVNKVKFTSILFSIEILEGKTVVKTSLLNIAPLLAPHLKSIHYRHDGDGAFDDHLDSLLLDSDIKIDSETNGAENLAKFLGKKIKVEKVHHLAYRSERPGQPVKHIDRKFYVFKYVK